MPNIINTANGIIDAMRNAYLRSHITIDRSTVRMNWDFTKVNTNFMTHGIHQYPAKMIPQIAEKLIRIYGKECKLILDPFCGSGGVLVEATRANIASIGLDINPLACLISKIKSKPISPKKLLNQWTALKTSISHDIISYRFKQFEPRIPQLNDPGISYWFKPYMISELSIIKCHIDNVKSTTLKDFFSVCFSNTVRNVSGTRKGEFKLYRMSPENWKNYSPNVFTIFAQKVEMAKSMMCSYYDFVIQNKIRARAKVFQADTRNLFEKSFSRKASTQLYEGSVDLIITSPPYGDSKTTVAYGQFSRNSLVLLGYQVHDAYRMDELSLGGRRNNTSINSKTLEKVLSQIHSEERRCEVLHFFVDLAICVEKLSKLLRNNAYACFVVGNRTVSGIRIPSDEILVELAKEFALTRTKTIHRNIVNKVLPFKNNPRNISGGLSTETISRETIIILRK